MKKLIVAAVAAIVFIANIQAQNKKWSLKECIDYAILHNIEVKQSQNRIKSLKVERNTLKSSFLPDLNVGASQRFSFGRALNQDNTYEDSNIQILHSLPVLKCLFLPDSKQVHPLPGINSIYWRLRQIRN